MREFLLQYFTNMDEILRSIGMETLLNCFQAQRMEPQSALDVFDNELVCLGVTTIGDQIRLRDACKRQLDDAAAVTSQTSAAYEERLSIFNPCITLITQMHLLPQEVPPVQAGGHPKAIHGCQRFSVWLIIRRQKHHQRWKSKYCLKLVWS